MTVSMPLSRIDDSSVVIALAMPDADDPRAAAVDACSPRSTPSSPVAASGPICRTSEMIWAITTTTVVNPSVALGLARM